MSRTIIITGANGALGTATVKKFLDEGYKVVAVGHGAADHLSFAAANANFAWKEVDLSREENATAFIQSTIAAHGRIDGALMLAGTFAMGDIAATDAAILHKMISINFETAFFIARSLFGHMMEQGYGRLVFIGARPALKPEQGKGTLAYSLSKGMLFHLADLLNATAKGKNVVTSVVVPSTIDTATNRKDMPDADFTAWVKPEQIAETLEFICSSQGDPIREGIYKIYGNA